MVQMTLPSPSNGGPIIRASAPGLFAELHVLPLVYTAPPACDRLARHCHNLPCRHSQCSLSVSQLGGNPRPRMACAPPSGAMGQIVHRPALSIFARPPHQRPATARSPCPLPLLASLGQAVRRGLGGNSMKGKNHEAKTCSNRIEMNLLRRSAPFARAP